MRPTRLAVGVATLLACAAGALVCEGKRRPSPPAPDLVRTSTGVTWEEAATVPQTIVTPARIPTHAMVNAYQQNHRLYQDQQERMRLEVPKPVSLRVLGELQFLDVEKLLATKVEKAPYDHVFVRQFLKEPYFGSVARDFPPMLKSQVTLDEEYLQSLQEIRGSFKELLHELRSPYLKLILAAVFNVDLQLAQPEIHLRGRSDKSDTVLSFGSNTLISVELFLFTNALHRIKSPGNCEASRTQLLRSKNINHVAVEYPSCGGHMLAFKNPNAFEAKAFGRGWHGGGWYSASPAGSPRWAVHLNYVTIPAAPESPQSLDTAMYLRTPEPPSPPIAPGDVQM